MYLMGEITYNLKGTLDGKVDEMSEERENKVQENSSPKSQWLWLIGLCLGGALSMYILAKVTKMLGLWAGLGN